jgi:hypothetical protein
VTAPFLASLLLPTRGRVQHLAKSLASLEATVTDPTQIEVLVKVDDDDAQTLRYLQNDWHSFRIAVVNTPRGNGYADLHKYCNMLCEMSQGRFLFLWNDDAEMRTQGWDIEIAQHDDGKLCYLNSRVSDTRGRDSYLFPIVHRSYFEALGRYSMSAHNDTYVYQVFKDFPQLFRQTEIVVHHNALELIAQGDRTSMDAKALWPTTKGLWNGSLVQNSLKEDVAKLAELVKQQA